jgi:hypothetical protein
VIGAFDCPNRMSSDKKIAVLRCGGSGVQDDGVDRVQRASVGSILRSRRKEN